MRSQGLAGGMLALLLVLGGLFAAVLVAPRASAELCAPVDVPPVGDGFWSTPDCDWEVQLGDVATYALGPFLQEIFVQRNLLVHNGGILVLQGVTVYLNASTPGGSSVVVESGGELRIRESPGAPPTPALVRAWPGTENYLFLALAGSTLEITDSEVRHVGQAIGGPPTDPRLYGVYVETGSVLIDQAEFDLNSVGLIANATAFTVTNSTFHNNAVGAAALYGATLGLMDVTVNNNALLGVYANGSTVQMDRGAIEDTGIPVGVPPQIGLFLENGSAASVAGTMIRRNLGGGVGAESSAVTLSNTSVLGQVPVFAAGISLNHSVATVTDSNVSEHLGFGLFVANGTADVRNTDFVGNGFASVLWNNVTPVRTTMTGNGFVGGFFGILLTANGTVDMTFDDNVMRNLGAFGLNVGSQEVATVQMNRNTFDAANFAAAFGGRDVDVQGDANTVLGGFAAAMAFPTNDASLTFTGLTVDGAANGLFVVAPGNATVSLNGTAFTNVLNQSVLVFANLSALVSVLSSTFENPGPMGSGGLLAFAGVSMDAAVAFNSFRRMNGPCAWAGSMGDTAGAMNGNTAEECSRAPSGNIGGSLILFANNTLDATMMDNTVRASGVAGLGAFSMNGTATARFERNAVDDIRAAGPPSPFLGGILAMGWDLDATFADNIVDDVRDGMGIGAFAWNNATLAFDADQVRWAAVPGIELSGGNVTADLSSVVLAANRVGLRATNAALTVQDLLATANEDAAMELSNSTAAVGDSALLVNGEGIVLQNASAAVITNSTVDSAAADFRLGGNSSATTLNTTFDKSSPEFEDALSWLLVEWFLHVHVESMLGAPVAGALIEVTNATAAGPEFSGPADAAGNVAWLVVDEYLQNATASTPYTPHNVSASLAALGGGSLMATMDASRLVVMVLADTALPTVAIAAPSNGLWTPAAAISATGTASDNYCLDRVEMSPDGGATWFMATGTAAWSFTVNLATGANVIHARSFDCDGGESVHDIITVNSDPTPPAVVITSHSNGQSLEASAITLAGTAADAGGLARVEVSCDNGATWSTATGTSSWSFSCTLSVGANALHARAFDLAGNESPHAVVALSYVLPDTTAPRVDATSPVNGATEVGTTAVVVIVFSEPMDRASVEAAVTASGNTPHFSWSGGDTTLVVDLGPLQPGTAYTVTVGTGARDKEGNGLAQATTVAFTTATPPPLKSALEEFWWVWLIPLSVLLFLLVLMWLGRRKRPTPAEGPPQPIPATEVQVEPMEPAGSPPP